MPRWLHHYGPKTYEFKEHLAALLVRHFCRLSYRRVKQLLDMIGIRSPSKSALHYTAQKLDTSFWQRVLKATCPSSYLVAIDSTGFSRTNPSYHYLRRIDRKIPRVPIKLSAIFDTRRKRFRAARIRVLAAHDVKDARTLIRNSRAKIVVADKAYNSESLYEIAAEKETLLMTPPKKAVKRGFYRKKMSKRFRRRTYNRRQLIESGFGSIKRKLGSSVSSRKSRTIKSELYGRLACHNIFFALLDF
jgi:transposase